MYFKRNEHGRTCSDYGTELGDDNQTGLDLIGWADIVLTPEIGVLSFRSTIARRAMTISDYCVEICDE